jgi:hypothetical protein
MELGFSRKERISVESLTAVKLRAYLQHLSQGDYMHFLSHPKMVNRHNLKTFSEFLEKVFTAHEIETDFRNMLP